MVITYTFVDIKISYYIPLYSFRMNLSKLARICSRFCCSEKGGDNSSRQIKNNWGIWQYLKPSISYLSINSSMNLYNSVLFTVFYKGFIQQPFATSRFSHCFLKSFFSLSKKIHFGITKSGDFKHILDIFINLIVRYIAKSKLSCLPECELKHKSLCYWWQYINIFPLSYVKIS